MLDDFLLLLECFPLGFIFLITDICSDIIPDELPREILIRPDEPTVLKKFETTGVVARQDRLVIAMNECNMVGWKVGEGGPREGNGWSRRDKWTLIYKKKGNEFRKKSFFSSIIITTLLSCQQTDTIKNETNKQADPTNFFIFLAVLH